MAQSDVPSDGAEAPIPAEQQVQTTSRFAFAAALSIVIYTWQHGTRLLFQKTRKLETPLNKLVEMLEKKPPLRVPGTAVFLTSDPTSAPTALMHSLKHYKVLHEKNVILSVLIMHTPRVARARIG
jgi:KUP system potassium uptake protein